MIYLKTDEEIELMRAANLLVGRTLAEVAKIIAPGSRPCSWTSALRSSSVTTVRLPAFLGYNGFPGSLCTSVNDHVVHGIPSSKVVLKDGDIVSVDCGTKLAGFTGDSAYTFAVGEVAPETLALLRTTKESLYIGIEHAVAGKRVGDIGAAVQQYCEARGYHIVRELEGHGIGKNMHEEPGVPNFGRRGTGPELRSGMCICIEPMVNMGSKNVIFDRDGWTVRTKTGKPSAHFEHCVAIRDGKADILSSFDFIKEVLVDREF